MGVGSVPRPPLVIIHAISRSWRVDRTTMDGSLSYSCDAVYKQSPAVYLISFRPTRAV